MCNLRVIAGATFLAAVMPFAASPATIVTSCSPACDPAFGAYASYLVITPVDVTVDASANSGISPLFPSVSASIDYRAILQITFASGTGNGFYTPNLNVGANTQRSGSAQAAASFGSAHCSASAFSAPECTLPMIPFVFGESFIETLHLSASASGSGLYPREGTGLGEASIRYFSVFDAQSNPISATWTVLDITDVPEPVAFVPVPLALLVLWRISRWRAFQ